MKLVLASGSPRRKELLAAAGIHFEIIPSPAEEIYDPLLGMAGLCEENARLKAVAVSQEGWVVIGADTLVFIDETPLSKPKDLEEAFSMLRRLSGRVHQVCTGVCVINEHGEVKTFHEVTDVEFRSLSDSEINEYLCSTNPMDKAGSYGIQDQGERIIKRITGAYDNVMGLPVARLLHTLGEIGLLIPPR